LLALLWTWPLATHLTSRVPNDPGDPILNTWILWWNAQASPLTKRWWNPPIFYPMSGALALSEHLAGIALITTPLQLAGASALTAYNVAFILSFALSGFLAYLLVRRLTGSTLAALCAGLAFGFSPYRAGQLAHLQVLTSQWMPLALLAMHAYVDGGRRRWLLVFAAAWLVQALSNGYYLLFFPILLVLWLAWFVDWTRAPGRGLELAGVWAGSSVLLLPVLLEYVAVHGARGLSRTPGEISLFSARLASFVTAPPSLAFWPTIDGTAQEGFLFPGVTAVALVVVGLVAAARQAWTRRAVALRSPLLFYSAATVIFWALACGPPPEGAPLMGRFRPYSALLWLPGFDSLRVPARFTMVASLSLAVAAGIALHSATAGRRSIRRWLGAAAIVGVLIDGWMEPLPLVPRPGRVLLPEVANSLVLELPCDDLISLSAMYRAMQHRRPLINGYSGHVPAHYGIFSRALSRGDPSGILELARGRPVVILVHSEFDPGNHLAQMVEALPGVRPFEASAASRIYVLPPQARERLAPPGTLLPAVLREMASERVEIDLGTERVVRSVEFPLRWHYAEMGERIAIEASRDGSSWTTVWEDWTAGLAISGALKDPLEIPLRIPISDVSTRYLRIHPSPAWMQRELRVYGPS
jgi:hypothetical protein